MLAEEKAMKITKQATVFLVRLLISYPVEVTQKIDFHFLFSTRAILIAGKNKRKFLWKCIVKKNRWKVLQLIKIIAFCMNGWSYLKSLTSNCLKRLWKFHMKAFFV